MINLVKELGRFSGVSGHEMLVRQFLMKELENAPAVSDIHVDRLGNCLVFLKGKQSAPKKVMFAAHMDEVGGIITGITDDGYLRFTTVGGILPDVL
ncbi:MAG: M42 family peptidase, partial [Clostridia bacterium]|nr:M42 family peptidase [Clostridia bacterium]